MSSHRDLTISKTPSPFLGTKQPIAAHAECAMGVGKGMGTYVRVCVGEEEKIKSPISEST
jgi:hypothetical protein